MSRHAGEHTLEINGKKLKLFFSWKTVGEAQDALGIEAVAKLSRIGALHPEEIAKLLKIGLSKHHPDISEEDIMEMSLPIVPVLAALDQAIAPAYYGPSLEPEKEKAGDKAAQKTDAKKKTS